jgi:alanyl-tRNA synthetase
LNFPVIFCPTVQRHVAKTGDIKDFVIIEESGIAKGIRRITAVTGHEAQEVTRLALSFESRLNQLELASGSDKDAGLKTLSVVRLSSFV